MKTQVSDETGNPLILEAYDEFYRSIRVVDDICGKEVHGRSGWGQELSDTHTYLMHLYLRTEKYPSSFVST